MSPSHDDPYAMLVFMIQDPRDELVRKVKELSSEMLVVGYRGRSAVKRQVTCCKLILMFHSLASRALLGSTLMQLNMGSVNKVASSMDSDLEAFSRNPTRGGFAPLAFQLRANTKYANQRFLSY